MTRHWFFRRCDQEWGPVGFSDLVRLVREGSLTADDLVREDWLDEWQRADSIVGLFYMARRHVPFTAEEPVAEATRRADPGVRRPWSTALQRLFGRRSTSVAEDPPSAPIILSSTTSTAASHHRGRNEDCRPRSREPAVSGAHDIREDNVTPKDSVVSCEPGEWSSVIADALAAAATRDAAVARESSRNRGSGGVIESAYALVSRPFRALVSYAAALIRGFAEAGGVKARDRTAAWIAALERRIPRPPVLRVALRVGAPFLGANLGGLALLAWSDLRALRFPGTVPDGHRAFPFLGEVGPGEFAVLLVQTVIVAAAAAYGLAAWLESRADD